MSVMCMLANNPDLARAALDYITRNPESTIEDFMAAKMRKTVKHRASKEAKYKLRRETLQEHIISVMGDRPMTIPDIIKRIVETRPITSGGIASSMQALANKGRVRLVGQLPSTDKNGKRTRPVNAWLLVKADGQ